MCVCVYGAYNAIAAKKIHRPSACFFHARAIISPGETRPTNAFENLYRTKRFVKRRHLYNTLL